MGSSASHALKVGWKLSGASWKGRIFTSINTILRYGEDKKAAVRYLGGRCEDVPLARLPDPVTESGDPENVWD
ncbi:MAG: hypothetical protein ACUVS1_02965 [Actinomycetota bacterium]